MKEFFRLAQPHEVQFYEGRFYSLQDQVLRTVALYGNKLYLTGGTALARFYFHHRLSDDLDFFTTTDDLKLIATDLIARLREQDLAVEIEQLDLYFARFFVVQDEVALKVDFVREPHLIGELWPTEFGAYINSLEDIGTNKITAFEARAEIKDIVDLFYITQQVPLDQLFALAERKRVPVAYEHMLTIHVTGISGRVLLTRPLEEAELQAFLALLQTRTEAEVKKKEQIATQQLDQVVARLLWDFPPEERTVNSYSVPVLKRRLSRLALPTRNALAKALVTAPEPHA